MTSSDARPSNTATERKELFEVWNKPDCGPLTVQERLPGNRLCTSKEDETVQHCKNLKKRHPHMDFLVRGVSGDGYSSQSEVARLVYRT